MAQTKVKLISDGVIVQGNLHSSHGITTAHIGEGSNLYYTDARVDTRVGNLNTGNLPEGSNLYYTDARADARIAAASTSDLSEGTNLYYTDARADARVALIVDSSPSTLNTLNELAAALGDDPNFAATTATSIGLKAPLASPSFTGFITTPYIKSTTSGNLALGGASGISRIQSNASNDIRFLNNSNQDLLTLVASTREATFAGNITAKVGNFQAPDATASIINQFADSNGNNCATFRTTTPGQIFEIRSQNSGTLKFDSTSSTFTGNVTINSNLTINGPSTKFNTDGDSFFEIADAGTNACYLRAGAGDEIYIGANNGYQLRLKTNKDVVMDNGGNLGINQTSPSFKLDVNGTGYFSDLLRVDEPVYSYTNSGTKHYTHLATGSLYGSGASAMIVTTNIPGHNQTGNANMFSFNLVGYSYAGYGMIDMTIGVYAGENNYYSASWTGTCQTNWIDDIYVYTDTNGKVAFQIGTVTDQLVCEIAATNFVQGFANVNADYSKGWSIVAVTTLPTQSNPTSVPYKAILPDVYEDVTFHNKVGIGTTDPSQELHVNAGTTNTVALFESTDATSRIVLKDNSGEGHVAAVGDNITFATSSSGSERMRITNAGLVGIGETSPVAQLDVKLHHGTGAFNKDCGARIGRIQYGWYTGQYYANNTAFVHIKTNLWMGGSHTNSSGYSGNSHYIMGGFYIKSYGYGGAAGEGRGEIKFHNWSGGFTSLFVNNYGNWATFVQNPYVSSDGFCVIVLRHNYYSAPNIDFHQSFTAYPWRHVQVTAQAQSSSTTGVY
jgi:hypothetical protein